MSYKIVHWVSTRYPAGPKINGKRLVLFGNVYYLYYIRLRDMNTTITIFEAIIVSGVTLIGYVFGKTVYEDYFKSSK